MNELIVLNFKNNNLSSVVSLSRELSKSEIMPSVTQKANKYLFYYIYNLDESVQNNIFYTSFYIDDCGYVRFQWFPEEEIHQIINGNF